MPEKQKCKGLSPVKVRWIKDYPGVPVFSGIEKIIKGGLAILDPHEAERAIKRGLAERVQVMDTLPPAPKKAEVATKEAPPKKAKEQS